MRHLTVTLIQADLVWENKTANLDGFAAKMEQIVCATDLIILPEMFSTGFTMNAPSLAEPMEGPTVKWMKEKAKKYDNVICGSIIIQENGKFFNRLIWMRPSGQWSHYDKKHLFTLAKEHHVFSGGSGHLLVDLKGWKIMPLICYDLRFPVWSRNTDGYDLLIYVANFPEKRSTAWKQLIPARAIENQSYTIGLNRVGVDGNEILYSGDSMVVDFQGNALYTSAYTESTHTVKLDYESQLTFRSRYAFLYDQGTFQWI